MNPLKLLEPIFAVLAAGGMILAPQAGAVSVSSLADSGPGTLRQAIAASAPGGTIDFAVTGTIRLTSGELDIGRNLSILGPGMNQLTIDGNQASRIFQIQPGVTSVITSLTISNGLILGTNSASGDGGLAEGGGILSQGTLSLTCCLITGNNARSGIGPSGCGAAYGGGIASKWPGGGWHSYLNLTDCSIVANVADGGGYNVSGGGGGIWSEETFLLSGCLVSENTARGGWGGGIRNYLSGSLTACLIVRNAVTAGGGIACAGYYETTLTVCTLSGNSATEGGAIATKYDSALYLLSCTISGNSASVRGGGVGLLGNPYPFRPRNTIIAGNSSSAGPDCYTTGEGFESQGFNLIGKTNGSYSSFSPWLASDLVGSALTPLDPLLTPLQDNGGPIPTMAPLPGSAAIDNGKSFGLTTDQRGLTRPADLAAYNNASGGDGADIGAVEVQWEPVDIDLRAQDGTGIIGIACEPPVPGVPMTSPLRIRKGTTTYGIILVETNASNASRIRIPTTTGIKAWAKLP